VTALRQFRSREGASPERMESTMDEKMKGKADEYRVIGELALPIKRMPPKSFTNFRQDIFELEQDGLNVIVSLAITGGPCLYLEAWSGKNGKRIYDGKRVYYVLPFRDVCEDILAKVGADLVANPLDKASDIPLAEASVNGGDIGGDTK